jgi:hypothetical protein
MNIGKVPLSDNQKRMIETRAKAADKFVVRYPAPMLETEDWDWFKSLNSPELRVELLAFRTPKGIGAMDRKRRDTAKKAAAKVIDIGTAPKPAPKSPTKKPAAKKQATKPTPTKSAPKKAVSKSTTSNKPRRPKVVLPDEDIIQAMVDRHEDITRKGSTFFVTGTPTRAGKPRTAEVRYINGEFSAVIPRGGGNSAVALARYAKEELETAYQMEVDAKNGNSEESGEEASP